MYRKQCPTCKLEGCLLSAHGELSSVQRLPRPEGVPEQQTSSRICPHHLVPLQPQVIHKLPASMRLVGHSLLHSSRHSSCACGFLVFHAAGHDVAPKNTVRVMLQQAGNSQVPQHPTTREIDAWHTSYSLDPKEPSNVGISHLRPILEHIAIKSLHFQEQGGILNAAPRSRNAPTCRLRIRPLAPSCVAFLMCYCSHK
jgi:hypothetical protein